MVLSRPAAMRMAAGAILLLALALLPSAQAQLPQPVGAATLAIVVTCNDNLLEPPYAGQDEANCLLQDLSRDAIYAPGSTAGGTGPNSHLVTLTARPVNASIGAKGWQVEISSPVNNMYGGDVIPFSVRAKATPVIDAQDYDFEIVAYYTGPGGYNSTSIVAFRAEVEQYDFALISWAGNQAQKAGQDDIIIYTVAVQNTGVYPDSYRFTINAPDDLRVTIPPNLFVPPGETRTTNISVLTPHNKLMEFGRSVPIGIKVNSVTGSGVYGTTAILGIRGPHVPTYWIPLMLVGLVSGAVVARGTRERAERARLEKGRPRPVGLSPRQEVLLVELRRTDRDAYREKRRALDSVYKERVTDYRSHRKERLAADRAEAKVARQEFLLAKKQRKEKRMEERKAARIARAEEKRAAKLRRKEEIREAKAVAKKERILGKKRAKLEKERAKAEAREAKLAAKRARADAKAAKAQAVAQKKAAREAKRQK